MDFPTLESLVTLDSARTAYGQLLDAHAQLLSRQEQCATDITDLQGQIETLKAAHTTALETERERVEALEQDLAAANALLDEAGKDNAALGDKLKSAQTSLGESAQKLTQGAEKLTAAQSRIAELESQAKSAEATAAQICASVGVDPVAVKPDGGDTQRSLLEQMRAIENPAEQMAFFRKHKEAILQGH